MPRRKRRRRRKPKLSFVLEVMHDERTDPSIYHSTEAWFVRHRLYPERTKTFVFGFVFVFVLAHEQPISEKNQVAQPERSTSSMCRRPTGSFFSVRPAKSSARMGLGSCRSRTCPRTRCIRSSWRGSPSAFPCWRLHCAAHTSTSGSSGSTVTRHSTTHSTFSSNFYSPFLSQIYWYGIMHSTLYIYLVSWTIQIELSR